MKKILIIAGSDPSGGAGIQADIRVAASLNIYASAVITSLTAQNTQKVSAIFNPPITFLQQQLDMVLDDIDYDAIKIGMLSNAEIIDCIGSILQKRAKNTPLILDTVMVATSGDLLLERNAVDALKSKLLNGCYIATPNIDEAQILAEMPIKTIYDMKLAASKIKLLGAKNILIKGGHLNFSDGKIRNIFLDEANKFHLITNKRFGTKNIHGTGCTLASALACNIAKNIPLPTAIRSANRYVANLVSSAVAVGKGSLVLIKN